MDREQRDTQMGLEHTRLLNLAASMHCPNCGARDVAFDGELSMWCMEVSGFTCRTCTMTWRFYEYYFSRKEDDAKSVD